MDDQASAARARAEFDFGPQTALQFLSCPFELERHVGSRGTTQSWACRPAADEILGLANRKPPVTDQAQRLELSGDIWQRQECSSVSLADFSGSQGALKWLRGIEQAERVGNSRAALPNTLGDFALGETKLLDQGTVGKCGLKWRKVSTLKVFNQSDLDGFPWGQLADDRWDDGESCQSCGAPASLPSDDLVGRCAASARDDDRLDDAVLADRLSELLQVFFAERLSGLPRVRRDLLDRDFLDHFGANGGGSRDQRIQPASKTAPSCHVLRPSTVLDRV